MRKIRILVSDPHATDSSSDEEQVKKSNGSKRRLAREVIIHMAAKDDEAAAAAAALHKQVVKSEADQVPTRGANPREKKKYVGVRRRRSGRYAAELRDPIRKKTVWIGTFDTPEEARDAWLAKKIQFQQQVAAALLPREPGEASNSSGVKIGVKVAPVRSNNDEGLKPVVRKEKKKKASKKRKKKKSIQQIIRTSDSSELKIKKEDVLVENTARSKKVGHSRPPPKKKRCIQQIDKTSSSSELKIKEEEEDVLMENHQGGSKTDKVLAISNDYSSQQCLSLGDNSCTMTKAPVLGTPTMHGVWKTEGANGVKFYGTYRSPTSVLGTQSSDWYNGGSETSTFDAETMQHKGDSAIGPVQEVNFSMMYALPIIDNHGFLLGQWSWIDDLSICRIEETDNPF